jgi:branched-chain amino acid transport system ATP-binding protein
LTLSETTKEQNTSLDQYRLSVNKISLAFGGVTALTDVSLEVNKGEIVAIIGPNGAGKTCLLNCMSGFYHPQSGRVYFKGEDVTKLSPDSRCKMGIGRTFQGIQVYQSMTVLDVILSGRHIKMKTNPVQDMIYWPWSHRQELEHREFVEHIIDFLEMASIRKKIVGELGYGLRKRTDLARALALEPDVLILDEPMAGMNLEEKEDIARFILDISEYQGIGIAVVEHDMEVVMDISNRVVVIDWGKVIATGEPKEIRTNPEVIKAYLGEE